MIGEDGIVLASDMKRMNEPRFTGMRMAAVGSTYGASKIKLDCKRRIAVSSARNMETAEPVADAILGLGDDCWVSPVGPIQRAAKPIIDANERKDVQCLIVTDMPMLRLFLFQSVTINGVPGQLICHEITDKMVTGQNTNAAVFWTERYYWTERDYQRRPVAELIPLAAQLIISASKLNSNGIGGLEIVECKKGGFRRLSDESIRELEAVADEWDKSIRRLFTSHPKQFTYAPDVIG
jgi:hypothetical protein